MSLGRPTNTYISPEEYAANQAKIEAAQKYLDDLRSQNDEGRKRFEAVEAQKRELERKIEEGEKARLLMEQLKAAHTNSTRGLLDGPRPEFDQPSARIEEVQSPDDQMKRSASSQSQRQASTPILSPPLQATRPNVNPFLKNVPHGSGPQATNFQRETVPMNAFPHPQPPYPHRTVPMPEALATSAHYAPSIYDYNQPVYSLQGSLSTQSHYRPNTAMASSSSYQPHHSVPSQMTNALPSQPKQSGPPQTLTKPPFFVLEKDNPPEYRNLNIPLAEIRPMKTMIGQFIHKAPLNTHMKVRPDVVAWKDTKGVAWIYIAVDEGFWRYRNLEAFFRAQLGFAELAKGPTPGPTPVVPSQAGPSGLSSQKASSTSVPNTVKFPPGPTVAQTFQPQEVARASKSAITLNQPAVPTNSRQAFGSVPSGSGEKDSRGSLVPKITTLGDSNANPAVPNPPVQVPTSKTGSTASPSASVSSLTSPKPPVDKKNLSKHILFALGKRPRPVVQRSPEPAPPAKKPALGLGINPSSESNTPAVVEPVAPPPLVSQDAVASSKSLAPETASQSIVATSSQSLAPGTAPAKAPTPATPTYAPQFQPTALLPAYDPQRHAMATQLAFAVAANAAPLPPRYHPRLETPVQVVQPVRENAQAGPSNAGAVREPLLLPSPSTSMPSHSATPVPPSAPATSTTSLESRRKEVYVLVPPRPAYLVAHKKRLAEKRAAHLMGEHAKSASLTWEKGPGDNYDEPVIVGEDYLGSARDTPSGPEHEALRLSATRLDALPCRWDRCDAVLNSADALLKHLNQHPPEPSPNNRSFTCLWTQCGRRCRYEEKHLENHAYLPLRCAYKKCDDTFRSATQLAKHFRSKHKDHALKPSAELRAPKIQQLPPVPGVVPAYLFVTKLVKPATISKGRHSQLIPNVATRIVDSDPERPARQRTRKAARSTGAQALPPIDAPRNDYDFITARSTRYSSYLSQPVDLPLGDLNSADLSELLDEGLMLWPGDGDSDDGQYHDDGGDGLMHDRGDIKIEDALEGQPAAAVSSISAHRAHAGQRMDEEEVVENMLTQG